MESLAQIKSLLQHAFDWVGFIAGCMGIAYLDKGNTELTRKQRLVRVFFGGVVAIYLTPLCTESLYYFFSISFSKEGYGGVAFIVGYFGLEGITKVVDIYNVFKGNNKK